MSKNNQAGFTLIELLISMTIAIIALLAVSQTYIATRAQTKIQSFQNRISEDGRYVMFMAGKIVSQAGYRNSPVTTIPADRITGNSTSVTVKYDGDTTATGNQINCTGAAAAETVYSSPNVISSGVVHSAQISYSGGALQCTYDGGTAIPWISAVTTGSNSSEMIDFKLSYGVDMGPNTTISDYGCGVVSPTTAERDCIADRYESNATGNTTGSIIFPTYTLATAQAYLPANIVSTKLCFVLRSTNTDSTIIKSANAKNCSNADITNSQNDGRLYRTFNTTILLKNR